VTPVLGNRKRLTMGTIIINGKLFAGNDVTIRDGKVFIDGKPQAAELGSGIDVEVTDRGGERARCVASVTSGGARGGAIRVAAHASAGRDGRKKQP